MYFEVLPQSPEEIITIYVIFSGACLVTFPLMKFIFNAVSKGVSKWN